MTFPSIGAASDLDLSAHVRPEGAWPMRALGDVADLLASRSIARDGDAQVTAVTTACLDEVGFRVAGLKTARMRRADVTDCVLTPGEVLVARSNTPELVGRAAVYKGEQPLIVASDLTIRIRPHAVLVPDFLAAYMSYLFVAGYWKERAGGASGSMKKITREQILALHVPVPPVEHQRKITDWLREARTGVERARAAAEAQAEAAGALIPALTNQAFHRGGRSWSRRRVGEVADVLGGIQKTPLRQPTRHHHPYVTVRNVQRGYLDLTKVERFEVTPEELARFRLRAGDVLVVGGNGSLQQIGRSAVFPGLDGEWIHQNHVIRVRFDEQAVVPRFASLYFSSETGISQMVEKASSTSGLHTLSKGKVEALEVPVPPISVQRAVLESLEAGLATARRARQAAEAQLAEVATLPAALLRRAFSGEL